VNRGATDFQIPRAWGLAWQALATTTDDRLAAVFGDDLTETAVASASPEVMEPLADVSLDGLRSLSAASRDELIDTFQTCVECRRSVAATRPAIQRHPSTVRYRLRKLESLTGRSLCNPKDVTDLALAIRSASHPARPMAQAPAS
jgi:DNA-binding PucR family transcriptional regulator